MRTATSAGTRMSQIYCKCWNRSTDRTFDCLTWSLAFRRYHSKNSANFANTSSHGWAADTTRSSSFKTGSHLDVFTTETIPKRVRAFTPTVYFRESFQRVGTSVAAYLQYQKICSSNLAPFSIRSNVSDPSRNIQDLDEYSMQKFLDDMVGPITEPSYKRYWRQREAKQFYRFILLSRVLSFFACRYLEYFIGLLSGDIKLNSLPLYLRFIKMESPPCMHHKISYHENEWSSFIKIFEGERFVFISGILRSILDFNDNL